jgi:formamidopyrimidine-DNA glycosylase
MPELPEVEIVTRRLKLLLNGRAIINAKLLRPRLSPENSPRQFSSLVRGARVEDIKRRGKYILIHLSNRRTILTHLRMTGRFIYLDGDAANTPHTRALFWLDDGKKLLFDDVRQFGVMTVVRTDELESLKYLKKLAPEPFSEEFSLDYLYHILKRSSQPIKLALLNQEKIAGLGNIYASEALHRARIDPRLPANKLSRPRTESLLREIKAVLSEAISNDGTFDLKTGDLDASYGRYEAISRVYEREALPCLTCQTPIRRITQGARSTYFCPKCQRR